MFLLPLPLLFRTSSRSALWQVTTSHCTSNCIRYSSSAANVTNLPRVIFSGIQPTGIPHLGNYLGALRLWATLQNEEDEQTELFFSIVDLHAITIKQNAKQLQQWRKEMLASLYAVGLSPERSTIFYQSSVPQHSELMWILSCTASMGYLSRMTQWKSKLALPNNTSPLDPSPTGKAALKLGLFSYPVLQAADILLYRTTHVPVGEDQAQHLEFARELAIGFNHVYAPNSKGNVPLLVPPQIIMSPAKRVMSLTNPTKKMSKSDTDEKSRILITDNENVIKKKINRALTDSIEGVSYDREARPGVSNLINLIYHMDESVASSPEELAKEFDGMSLKALKEKVAETVEMHIHDVRERYKEIMAREKARPYLAEHASISAEKAKAKANATMRRVKRKLWRAD